MVQFSLPDDLFARLQALAVPLVDTPADVVRRLVDFYEENQPPAAKQWPGHGNWGGSRDQAPTLPQRAPRERGTTVEIWGHVIQAVSVRDLYERALKLLVDNGHAKRLKEIIPFRTSGQRYLIAEQPIHPAGNRFVVPVEYKGFVMEAHKDYTNAKRHLEKLIKRLGGTFRDLG
jgi:hypothetical protein